MKRAERNSGKDRCYFCGVIAQYNFTLQTPVCKHHWDLMYYQVVPDYVADSQILNYKKLALEKKIKDGTNEGFRNGRSLRRSS